MHADIMASITLALCNIKLKEAKIKLGYYPLEAKACYILCWVTIRGKGVRVYSCHSRHLCLPQSYATKLLIRTVREKIKSEEQPGCTQQSQL